jgi:endo-1,4-beta-D-glucanase Y
VAARYSELEGYQGILDWTKENLTKEEVNKLLLATDNKGRKVIHLAVI